MSDTEKAGAMGALAIVVLLSAAIIFAIYVLETLDHIAQRVELVIFHVAE